MTDANGLKHDAPKGDKHYSAPQLTEYGNVSKLTMKGGSFTELATNKKATSCL